MKDVQIPRRGFFLFILMWSIIFPMQEASPHLPGGNLRFRKFSHKDFMLKLALFPQSPELGDLAEVIIYIENMKKGIPFVGPVEIHISPRESSSQIQRYKANRFKPGYYEIQYAFPQKGKYDIVVSFWSGGKQMRIKSSVEIGKGPNLLLLGIMGMILMISFATVAYLRSKKGRSLEPIP